MGRRYLLLQQKKNACLWGIFLEVGRPCWNNIIKSPKKEKIGSVAGKGGMSEGKGKRRGKKKNKGTFSITCKWKWPQRFQERCLSPNSEDFHAAKIHFGDSLRNAVILLIFCVWRCLVYFKLIRKPLMWGEVKLPSFSRYFCNWLSCLITNVSAQPIYSELDFSQPFWWLLSECTLAVSVPSFFFKKKKISKDKFAS